MEMSSSMSAAAGKRNKKGANGNKYAHTDNKSVKVLKNPRMLAGLFSQLAMVRAINVKRACALKEQAEFKAKYVIVDSKDTKFSDPFGEKLAFFDEQLKALKSAVRADWGSKVVRLRLPVVFTITASGAGVINTVIPVDPTAQTEFTAMAAIFDEFKVVGGVIQYNMPTVITAAAGQSGCASIGYDPTDQTVQTAQLNIIQLQQHQLIDMPVFINGTAGNPCVNTRLREFKFWVPEGTFEINVANGPVGGAQWQATNAAAYFPYGGIKTYGDGLIGAVPALTGFFQYHLEFRCRS